MTGIAAPQGFHGIEVLWSNLEGQFIALAHTTILGPDGKPTLREILIAKDEEFATAWRAAITWANEKGWIYAC